MHPKDAIGRYGEQLAAHHLHGAGLTLLARNWRCTEGEVDIVARDGDVLVFCEVKTRIVRLATRDVLGPFAAIGVRKQRQVRAMAREWLGQGRIEGTRPPELRFDAIGVSFDAAGRLLSLEHLEGAF